MEYYAVVFKGESLSHHGILGMKWGVRRYQNPDGTLTEEGKRRYRYSDLKGKYIKRTKDEIEDYDKSQKLIKELTESSEARQEALNFWNPSIKESDLNEAFREHSYALFNRVAEESVDWYNSNPVSDAQKKIWQIYTDAEKQIRSAYTRSNSKKYRNAMRMMCIQALKEMNIPVNEKNITSMDQIIFWD